MGNKSIPDISCLNPPQSQWKMSKLITCATLHAKNMRLFDETSSQTSNYVCFARVWNRHEYRVILTKYFSFYLESSRLLLNNG